MHYKYFLSVKHTTIPIAISFSILFLFGGTLQFIGLTSPTLSNVVVLLSLAVFCSLSRADTNPHREKLLLIPFFFIILTGLFSKSNPSSFAVYFYYFACLLISLIAARKLAYHESFQGNRFWGIALYFLAFQCFIAVLQTLFAENISAISRVPLIPLDVASGTFYLKSDATLSFTGIFALIASFHISERRRYWLACIVIAICFTSNSKVSQAASLMVAFSLASRDILIRIRMPRILFALLILAASALILTVLHDEITKETSTLLDYIYNTYLTKEKYEEANRLAVLGEIIFGNTNLFGYGLLTYYNPLDKTWIYYSGFSLVYSLFFDSGISGVLVFFSCFFFFTKLCARSIYFSVMYFSAFVIFSLFNFSISDISILLAYGFFINLSRGRNFAHA